MSLSPAGERPLSAMRARAQRVRRRRDLAPPERRRAYVALWLPTTVIFALLAPFALALSPFLLLAPARYRLGPHTMFAVGAMLFALSGTHIDVDTPDARVRLHLF